MEWAGLRKLEPKPARKKQTQPISNDGEKAAAAVQMPTNTWPCNVVLRMPKRSANQPLPKVAPVIANKTRKKRINLGARQAQLVFIKRRQCIDAVYAAAPMTWETLMSARINQRKESRLT
ncbi:MAG: hypothetical protein ACREPG_02845 [Candidatus Binatia bacterium]